MPGDGEPIQDVSQGVRPYFFFNLKLKIKKGAFLLLVC